MKIKAFFKKKSVIALAVIVILGGGYYGYKKATATTLPLRYITAPVERGTLIISVTGSGQVAVSNQVDIKPKVSGDLLNLNVTPGQEVKAGFVIALINARDAQKTVRDAESSLDSAKLSLDKIKQPADAYSIMQAEHSLTSAEDSLSKLKLSQASSYQSTQDTKKNAEEDLKNTYEDGFNKVAAAFIDLPEIMTGLYDTLIANSNNSLYPNIDYYANVVRSYEFNSGVEVYRNSADADYTAARAAYDKNYADYKASSRFSDTAAIEALVSETYETAKVAADSIKSGINLIQFYEDTLSRHSVKPIAAADTALSNLSSYSSEVNAHLLNMSSLQTAIQNDKDAISKAVRDLATMDQNNPLDITAAEASIAEKQGSLAKLKAGADPLDIRSQELSVQQRQNALADAREKLADYTIKAPFDGVIAAVGSKKGDSVSSGTALATLITKQHIAEISLNEVDVAKVKVGQKVTLTFDAVPDLSLTGEVAEVDALGVVSQGVVNYKVKIGFDAQDDRIKPGMSVSAGIITEAKQDVLLVSLSAVKTQGNNSYVEIMQNGVLTPVNITVGESNDSQTEVSGNIKEGDEVVTQTIDPNKTTTGAASQSSSGLRIPGVTSGGGGGGFGR